MLSGRRNSKLLLHNSHDRRKAAQGRPTRGEMRAYRWEKPLLAGIADYFFVWEIPVALAVLVAWTCGGGYLFHRAVRGELRRRKAGLARALGIAFLGALAGAVAGGIILFLVDSIDRKNAADLRFLGIGLGALSFLAINFVVLYAAFEAPLPRLFRAWALGYAPAAALTALVAVPAAGYAFKTRRDNLARQHSLEALRFIHQRILTEYVSQLRAPPATLQRLVDDNILRKQVLQARANRGRAVDYFYLPAPIPRRQEKSDRILACDFLDNHDGRGRVILFTNGAAEWYPRDRVKDVFDLLENRAFAAALKEAEASLKKP